MPSLRRFTAAILLFAAISPAAWSRTARRQLRIIRMQATAYTPTAKPTAGGTLAHQGVAAADPAVLPLNSRIRVTGAGRWSGIYNVRDTGSKVVGRRIDLCVATTAAARHFGKRAVTVRVLKIGDNKPLPMIPGPAVK